MSEELSIAFRCQCGNGSGFGITVLRGGDSGVKYGIEVECDDCGVVQEFSA